MKIKYIIIHHSAVSRTKNSEQFDAINNYHKRKGWGMIGYHYLIEPDGKIKTGRLESQSGAHCIGRNYDSLGICLTGNFDIEKPMTEQEESLRFMLVHSLKKYPKAQIKYHRDFANKTCPGKLITDNWAKNLISNDKKMKLKISRGHLYVVEEASKFGWSIPEDKIALPAIKAHFEKLGIPLGDPEVFDPDNYFIVHGSTKEQIVNFFNV